MTKFKLLHLLPVLLTVSLLSSLIYYQNDTVKVPSREVVSSKKVIQEKSQNQDVKKQHNLLRKIQQNMYVTTLKTEHPAVFAIAQTIPHALTLIPYLTELAVQEDWMEKSNGIDFHQRVAFNIKTLFMHGPAQKTTGTADSPGNPLTPQEMNMIADIMLVILNEHPLGLMNVPLTEYDNIGSKY